MYNELNTNNEYESYIVMIIKDRDGMSYPNSMYIYFFYLIIVTMVTNIS